MDGDGDAKKIPLDRETGAQQIVRSIRFCESSRSRKQHRYRVSKTREVMEERFSRTHVFRKKFMCASTE